MTDDPRELVGLAIHRIAEIQALELGERLLVLLRRFQRLAEGMKPGIASSAEYGAADAEELDFLQRGVELLCLSVGFHEVALDGEQAAADLVG